MKKVLLASTALVMTAGVAAAEVSVGGDGRMGLIRGYSDDTTRFTSRIRISFAASGETDGGLAFGGSIRADNAGGFNLEDGNGNNPGDAGFDPDTGLDLTATGGVSGQSGTVFIEGGFGKLSMGDVDGAAKAAVGHVSGVGLTGLSDRNESTYVSNVGGNLPGALYEFSTGGFGLYLSASNPGDVFSTAKADNIAVAIGATYAITNFTFALGYEDNDAGAKHIIGGSTGSFGGFTGKLIAGQADITGVGKNTQYGVSGDYTFGATTLTAFYTDDSKLGGNKAYGLGAAYDLGGGASLKAGVVQDDTVDGTAYDLGISFSF